MGRLKGVFWAIVLLWCLVVFGTMARAVLGQNADSTSHFIQMGDIGLWQQQETVYRNADNLEAYVYHYKLSTEPTWTAFRVIVGGTHLMDVVSLESGGIWHTAIGMVIWRNERPYIQYIRYPDNHYVVFLGQLNARFGAHFKMGSPNVRLESMDLQ